MTNQHCWGNHKAPKAIIGEGVVPTFTYRRQNAIEREYWGTEAFIGSRIYCGIQCFDSWWLSEGQDEYPHLQAHRFTQSNF